MRHHDFLRRSLRNIFITKRKLGSDFFCFPFFQTVTLNAVGRRAILDHVSFSPVFVPLCFTQNILPSV
jgi:hypothetical protein